MTYAESMAALTAKRRQMAELQLEMRALQAGVEPDVVQDYVLDGWEGPVRLSGRGKADQVCRSIRANQALRLSAT